MNDKNNNSLAVAYANQGLAVLKRISDLLNAQSYDDYEDDDFIETDEVTSLTELLDASDLAALVDTLKTINWDMISVVDNEPPKLTSSPWEKITDSDGNSFIISHPVNFNYEYHDKAKTNKWLNDVLAKRSWVKNELLYVLTAENRKHIMLTMYPDTDKAFDVFILEDEGLITDDAIDKWVSMRFKNAKEYIVRNKLTK